MTLSTLKEQQSRISTEKLLPCRNPAHLQLNLVRHRLTIRRYLSHRPVYFPEDAPKGFQAASYADSFFHLSRPVWLLRDDAYRSLLRIEPIEPLPLWLEPVFVPAFSLPFDSGLELFPRSAILSMAHLDSRVW